MWGVRTVGARKNVVTRRAVLVVAGLTVLVGIEQERSRSAAAGEVGEVDAATSGRPSPSPNGPQPQLTQSRAAQAQAAQIQADPTHVDPTKTVTVTSAPSSATPHPTRTKTVTAEAQSPKAAPKRATKAGDDEPLYYVHDGRKRIALTIDDGPSPIYTPQVLKLLEKYGVTAMFSMIGIQARAYPGIAREVADAGHVIANHTWTHLDLPQLSSASVKDQLSRATGAIHKATGRTPKLFRAPYGAWSPEVLQLCAKARMTPVDWSVDPRDWARPGVNSIVDNIMSNTRTGSIILEHDGGGDRSETVAALSIVLPRLIDAGYRFVTPA
jgi:peptidoglycan-N-acetylglucosamine deacetylase